MKKIKTPEMAAFLIVCLSVVYLEGLFLFHLYKMSEIENKEIYLILSGLVSLLFIVISYRKSKQ